MTVVPKTSNKKHMQTWTFADILKGGEGVTHPNHTYLIEERVPLQAN